MFRSKLFKTVLGLSLLVGLVWFVGPAKVLAVFGELTLPLILFLFFLSVVLIFISALKWKVFLEADGESARLDYLFVLYLVGYFVNLLVPSFIGGDIVRSWYAGRKRIQKHSAYAATVLERYTGFVAMIAIALLTMWFIPNLPRAIGYFVIVVAFLLFLITTFSLSPKLLAFGRKRLPSDRIWTEIETFQASLRFLGRNRKVMVEAMVLSLLFHLFAVMNAVVAAHAVGWESVPLLEMFVIVPVVLVIAAIPLAPAGLGLQEGAFYFFLTMIGASPAEAVGVGLVLRGKNYVLAVLGGILWLFLHDQKKELQA